MFSFWQEIYDAAKDKRYGMLFFGTFLGLILMVVVGLAISAMVGAVEFNQSVVLALLIVGCFAILAIWRAGHRFRTQQNGRSKHAALSRDEISKARSKLSKLKPVGRPASRPPDTNLNY